MGTRVGACGLAAGFAMTVVAEQGRVVDPFEVIAVFDRFAAMELWPGFDGALMESTDEELVITVLPAGAGE